MHIVRTILLVVHLFIATTCCRGHAYEAKGENPYNPSTNPTPSFTFYRDPKGISYRGPKGYPFPAPAKEEDLHPSSVDSMPSFTFHRGPRGHPFPAPAKEEDLHPSFADSRPSFTFRKGARGHPFPATAKEEDLHPSFADSRPSFTSHQKGISHGWAKGYPFPVIVGERAYTLEEYEGTLSMRTRRAYTFTVDGRAYTLEEYEEMQWMGDTQLTCKPVPSFKEASFKEPMPSFREDEVQMDRYKEAFPLSTCNSSRG